MFSRRGLKSSIFPYSMRLETPLQIVKNAQFTTDPKSRILYIGLLRAPNSANQRKQPDCREQPSKHCIKLRRLHRAAEHNLGYLRKGYRARLIVSPPAPIQPV